MRKIFLFSLLLIFCCKGIVLSNYETSSEFINLHGEAKKSQIISMNQLSDSKNYFFENKGQIKQTDGQPAAYVKYAFQRGDVDVFLLANCGMAYQFSRFNYPKRSNKFIKGYYQNLEASGLANNCNEKITLETFRMDMKLIGADTNAHIIAEDKGVDYYHYYNYNALNVQHYKKVTYKNVYPQIDWVIYCSQDGGIKYDFVVHPGGDPSKIKLKFTHHEELYIDNNGNLIHANRMGQFIENAPISFQSNRKVPTQFILKDDIISFEVASYDKNVTLIIDPNRIWSTYYGGEGREENATLATDNLGNIYLAGTTRSTSNIASGGSYQSSFIGETDAFLVKFNSNGVRLWSTYYGGDKTDEGWSVAVDNSGFIYLTGRTNSINNISTTGSHQPILTNFSGATFPDAFLVKFNPDGVRLWGTYFGGNDTDHGSSLEVDEFGFIYLAGYTLSPNNISTPGAFKTDYGIAMDGFVTKFSSDGVRQWGTYFGGNGGDDIGQIILDDFGYFYISGRTSSPNIATPGAHQNYLDLYGDGYLAKFTVGGNLIWSTYYGGSKHDWSGRLGVDAVGNVYICGTTASGNNISTPGSHQTYNMGVTYDAFLAKFNSDGVRQWGTYYGGIGADAGTSLVVDNNGSIFISGWTGSNSNIATLDSYQSTIAADSFSTNGFIVKFNSDGLRQWGTYYGGGGDDIIQFLAIDNLGNLCFSGITMSTFNIASLGAHQNVFSGGVYDAFLVKFDPNSNVSVVLNDYRSDFNISPQPKQRAICN